MRSECGHRASITAVASSLVGQTGALGRLNLDGYSELGLVSQFNEGGVVPAARVELATS